VGIGVRAGATGVAVALLLAGCGGSGSGAQVTGDASTRLQPAESLSDTQLDAAAETLGKRLAAAGIEDVDVSVDDGGLLLTGAKSAVDEAVPLAEQRGVLRFRLADAQTSGSGSSTSEPAYGSDFDTVAAAYTDWDCSADGSPTDGEDSSADFTVACDESGGFKYLLAPSELDGSDVVDAHATVDPQTNQWLVQLAFAGTGRDAWFDLTKQAYEAPSTCPATPDPAGCNLIAMVLDGVVLSAPSSQQDGIPGGATQIAGDFTEQQAKQLAAVLGGSVLPTSFSRA
jgi:preprotein translocase subunit SecD